MDPHEQEELQELRAARAKQIQEMEDFVSMTRQVWYRARCAYKQVYRKHVEVL